MQCVLSCFQEFSQAGTSAECSAYCPQVAEPHQGPKGYLEQRPPLADSSWALAPSSKPAEQFMSLEFTRFYLEWYIVSELSQCPPTRLELLEDQGCLSSLFPLLPEIIGAQLMLMDQ